MIGGILKGIAGPIANAVTAKIQSKTERERMKAEIELAIVNFPQEKLKAAADIIVAEAQSQSWVTRSWRPIIMLLFGAIIANNYILYPYLSLFFSDAPMLEIPPDMWDLLKIGIGGYIVGRSGEQAVKAWKK